jgi:hypothetical protein
MDLTPYVERIRRELVVAAEAGGEEAQALAERLTAPLESAVRLALLEALSAAAADITSDLAPGSVHVQLSGRDPAFVVAVPPAEQPATEETAAPAARIDDAALPAGERGGTSRINLRLPDDVKAGVEDAAARERISVNAWLVRAAAAALQAGRSAGPGAASGAGHRVSGHGQSFTGWAR